MLDNARSYLAVNAEGELACWTLSHIIITVDHGWALAQSPETVITKAYRIPFLFSPISIPFLKKTEKNS
jgi:hypothetical protein